MEVAKVRVEPKSHRIPDLKHYHYTTSSTPIAWQTDLFIEIASCHETECATAGAIALANLLPPEYRWWNKHYLYHMVETWFECYFELTFLQKMLR